MNELIGDFVRLGFLLTLFGFAAWVAWEKGREPVTWFVLAFFLSPVVALVALSAVPPMHLARRQRELAARRRPHRLEDPAIVAERLVNGLPRQEKRWGGRKVNA